MPKVKFKVVGKDDGKHLVEFEDGRRELLTDRELAELGGDVKTPSAEKNVERLDNLIHSFQAERAYIVFEKHPDQAERNEQARSLIIGFASTLVSEYGMAVVDAQSVEGSDQQVATLEAKITELEEKLKEAEAKNATPLDFVFTLQGLTQPQQQALADAGLKTKEQLAAAQDADLLKVTGIGDAAVLKIREALKSE